MSEHRDRHRDFRFTINNWTHSDIIELQYVITCSEYLIIGYETAPSTGTPHLQGYVYFTNPRTKKGVSKLLTRAAIYLCDASPEQNRSYCVKDGNYEEFGLLPRQGKRTDLDDIKKMVKDGASMRQIYDVASSYQAYRMAEVGQKLRQPPMRKDRIVKWYWGPTGSGKTRAAFEEAGDDYWMSSDTLQWWDGYDGQSVVIIDEFRSDFCKFHTLLRYLDIYPIRVPIKGGFVPLLATTIIVTSCYHPDDVYTTIEDKSQLLRRIAEIREFGEETSGTEVSV